MAPARAGGKGGGGREGGGGGQRSDPTSDGRKNARNGSMEEEGEGRLMDGEERAGLLPHAITFVIVTEPSGLRGHCHEPIQYTMSKNELYSRFCKLFSESSTGIPALLPCSLLPRQARGTLRKLFTKPHCTVHFGT